MCVFQFTNLANKGIFFRKKTPTNKPVESYYPGPGAYCVPGKNQVSMFVFL
jgi:hypothetical protein